MNSKRLLRLLLESIGLALIIASVFLTTLTFYYICIKGVFVGAEPNSLILFVEVVLVVFCLIPYCVFLYYTRIKEMTKKNVSQTR